MKGILIYQPTSKSAPLADFIDGLDPRLREKILLRLYFLTQLEKPEMKNRISSDFQSSAIGISGSCG